MSKLAQRIKTYSHISTTLFSLSDKQLYDLINKAEHLYSGIGGKAVLLNIDNNKIFVKRIPLTDLERKPENIMSTANLFDLPFSSHIGVGSAGFSSWRELFLHIMTTNWVISGACKNFPILYHWRVLSCDKPKSMNEEEIEKLDKDVKYWDNSPAVRKRLEAIHAASAHVYLFLEYLPQTLDQWLEAKLIEGKASTANALDFVDIKLKETNLFMNSQGLIHFDAHFANILADDDTIYFSDFGLALSSKFEMSNEEVELFDAYLTYDQCSTVTNFLHSINSSLLVKDKWNVTLQNAANDKVSDFEPVVAKIIKQYVPIAQVMDDFYQNMQQVSKSTPYPSEQLTKLLVDINKNIKSEITICTATDEEIDLIHDKIKEFNHSKVPLIQPEPIYQNYIIRDNAKIIAGINSVTYHWGILYVDVLFVDENYRNQDLGSKLLQKIENEAIKLGASMAHLDTFDFQAKDFYIKQGYEIFGILEDCPIGHKRYYLFKHLQN